MKAIRCAVVVCLFLVVTVNQCLALWEIEHSTSDRAKELGLRLDSKAMSTNEVGVWIELKPKGKLEGFSHVSLEIGAEGKRLVSANLLPSRQSDESVVVHFYTDPANLPSSKITVYVRDGNGPPGTGYQFALKDIPKGEVR